MAAWLVYNLATLFLAVLTNAIFFTSQRQESQRRCKIILKVLPYLLDMGHERFNEKHMIDSTADGRIIMVYNTWMERLKGDPKNICDVKYSQY